MVFEFLNVPGFLKLLLSGKLVCMFVCVHLWAIKNEMKSE